MLVWRNRYLRYLTLKAEKDESWFGGHRPLVQLFFEAYGPYIDMIQDELWLWENPAQHAMIFESEDGDLARDIMTHGPRFQRVLARLVDVTKALTQAIAREARGDILGNILEMMFSEPV